MIRVGSIEDIPRPARDRIKAKVMRRVIDHLRDRPEIPDEILRAALGFDRHTLEAMHAGLSEGAVRRAAEERSRPLVAGIAAAQAPMSASLGRPPNESAPPSGSRAHAAGAFRRRAGVRD